MGGTGSSIGSSRGEINPNSPVLSPEMKADTTMSDAFPTGGTPPAIPDWASQSSGAPKFAGIAQPSSTPMANLGFPTSGDPQGFNHALYGANNNTGISTGNNNAGTSVGSVSAPADTAAKEDPNARVAVYLPASGFGYGTPSGTFGNTALTYQQRDGWSRQSVTHKS